MSYTDVERIKTSKRPPSTQLYARILSKQTQKMIPSPASSSRGRRLGGSPPASLPKISTTPAGELAELSDVQCYTCRRRHVKCDRILPTCAKCAKKGVPCLGYQKPLRWAEGVAVRGKLKGKSQPVVDSNVVNIVRNTIQLTSDSAITEAAHFGVHATERSLTDVVASDATALELINYHNLRICEEKITFEQSVCIERSIARLSPENLHKLPRAVVSCILGNAAVHRASRQPNNHEFERLALETKVNVLQSFNLLLKSPQTSSPDAIVACGLLIFAMDLFEHGMDRWLLHFLGNSQIMCSFGGIQNLVTHYPHLQLALTHTTHLENFWIVLSHISITKPKQASRKMVELFCCESRVRRKFFNPCPAPLTLAVWDIGNFASRVLGNGDISFAEMQKRDGILRDILAFRPEDGAKDIKECYYKDTIVSEQRMHCWALISATWKAATTILCLRYLYFGRPNLAPPNYARTSQLSSTEIQATSSSQYWEEIDPYFHFAEDSSFFEDTSDQDSLPEHLSTGYSLQDTSSRSPSPLPSPGLYHSDPMTTSLWEDRYNIYNEAFFALAASFEALRNIIRPESLRHILMPLIILAFVSSPDSTERALCKSYCAAYKEFMTTNYPRDTANSTSNPHHKQSTSPLGGEELKYDIPLEELDAYSERVQHERASQGYRDGLNYGAPEWNWWDMLSHLKMNTIWPVASGTSHMERGTEFWAFGFISSVVNEECFSKWMESPSSSPS